MKQKTSTIILAIVGHAVEFITTDSSLLDTLAPLYPIADSQTKPTAIKVHLHCSKTTQGLSEVQFNTQALTLFGENGQSRLFADREQQTGEIYLCDQLLKNPYLLRHQFINSVCYFLLSYQHITPLHCCAFDISGHTFLCLGQSGYGKSTIAMSALTAGFNVLSEDLAFIANQQIHADCREIHLMPDSLMRFSQLKTERLNTSHNGKRKFIFPNLKPARFAKAKNLSTVFIRPQFARQSSIVEKNNEQQPFKALYHPTEAGFTLDCQSRHEDIHWLSQQPSYIAYMGSDTTDFLQQLTRLAA